MCDLHMLILPLAAELHNSNVMLLRKTGKNYVYPCPCLNEEKSGSLEPYLTELLEN